MATEDEDLSALMRDAIARLLSSGKAQTLWEAEEMYLDSCLPEVIKLLEGPLSNEELAHHPLYRRRSGTALSLLKVCSMPGPTLNVTRLIVGSQDEQTTSAGWHAS